MVRYRVSQFEETCVLSIGLFAQLDPSSFTSSFANRTTNFFDHGSSLDECELDPLLSWKGKKSTDDMYTELESSREAEGTAPVGIPSIRKALKGVTHRRGRSETRGRKRNVSKRGVEALDRTRRRLLVKTNVVPCFTSSPTVPIQFPYGSPTVPLPQKPHFP